MWCEKLIVLTSSSGRSGEPPKAPAGISDGLVDRMVLRDRLGRIDREEGRRAAVARRCRDRIRGDLAVDRSGGEIGIGLLVADRLGGLAGRKLDDLDLGGIDAVLLQDHLEQIDIGRGAADDADAVAGELRNLGDLRAGFLAFALGGRRHPQHRDVLAQRRHGLRILRHVEIAADDGEIGLAVGQRLGARGGAVGLHRAQPDMAVGLGEGLRQRLHHLEVIAVGRTDRDPQGHRPHRKIIAAGQRADDGEDAGQHDEHHLAAWPSAATAAPAARPGRGPRSSIWQTVV